MRPLAAGHYTQSNETDAMSRPVCLEGAVRWPLGLSLEFLQLSDSVPGEAPVEAGSRRFLGLGAPL